MGCDIYMKPTVRRSSYEAYSMKSEASREHDASCCTPVNENLVDGGAAGHEIWEVVCTGFWGEYVNHWPRILEEMAYTLELQIVASKWSLFTMLRRF